MYTAYWKLTCRPFDSAASARFYYPSQTHQATLLKLRYAVENRCGAALLAGSAGLGKTLLVRSLFRQLPQQYGPRVHVKFPQMAPPELLAYLADELTGERSSVAAIDSNLHRIDEFLAKNAKGGRHAVLVIDEAHLLRDGEILQTARLLLNFAPAWTTLLVGQPDLLPVLKRMPALEERFDVKCLLRRFTVEESIGYIQHRLRTAGAAGAGAIFSPEALEAVHHLCDGVPRRINRLCDLALLVGFAEEYPRIEAVHVEAVMEELATGIPHTRQAA